MTLKIVVEGGVVKILKLKESVFHFPGTEKGWVESALLLTILSFDICSGPAHLRATLC